MISASPPETRRLAADRVFVRKERSREPVVDDDLSRRRAILRAERSSAQDADAQRFEETTFDDALIGPNVGVLRPVGSSVGPRVIRAGHRQSRYCAGCFHAGDGRQPILERDMEGRPPFRLRVPAGG